jgi:hypothetical protein
MTSLTAGSWPSTWALLLDLVSLHRRSRRTGNRLNDTLRQGAVSALQSRPGVRRPGVDQFPPQRTAARALSENGTAENLPVLIKIRQEPELEHHDGRGHQERANNEG